jgi:hypothetical protein
MDSDDGKVIHVRAGRLKEVQSLRHYRARDLDVERTAATRDLMVPFDVVKLAQLDVAPPDGLDVQLA